MFWFLILPIFYLFHHVLRKEVEFHFFCEIFAVIFDLYDEFFLCQEKLFEWKRAPKRALLKNPYTWSEPLWYTSLGLIVRWPRRDPFWH